MTTERRLKTLKTRLKSLMASFMLIKTFVDEYNAETDACQVPVRLENLMKLWTDVNSVQGEMETLDPTNLEQHLKTRVEFESTYYRVKGFLLSATPVPPPSPGHPNGSNSVPTSSIRLPDVKLPIFSGQFDSWMNFHDLFVSLVHSSHDLSNIQKFYYLRSSLSGEALKLIQTITISSNNYQVAWNLLVEHYQNPTRLKQFYVDALFDFSTLKKESATELHSLVEKFEANVRVLKQLGEKTEYWDVLLIRMLSIRLDATTRRDWEDYASTQNQITFKVLTTFLQRRVSVLQSLNHSAEAPSQTTPKKPSPRPVASHGASQTNYRKCITCSNHHPLYMCDVFSKMTTEDKEKEVRRNQLCRNCLRKGHQARDCQSTSTCRKCKNRHHTQLCPGETPVAVNSRTTDTAQPKVASPPVADQQPSTSASAVTKSVSCSSSIPTRKSVLLATAVVNLIDDNGTKHVARALLDSGSECCFMAESLAQQMKAKRIRTHVPIAGIGQSATHVRQKLQSTVRSRTSEFSTAVEFLILPKVTVDLPSASIDTSDWEIPTGIQLADPSFYDTRPVQLVLGAEIFFDLFKVSGRIELGESLPNLVNSVLGWVVSGRTSDSHSKNPVIANVATVTDLHRLMERFWTIEEDNTEPCYSVEEAACEEHFRRTVSRTPEGRYVVSLPLKEDVLANLGDNRRTAVRRFHLLQGQLAKNDELAVQYRAFMDEYLQLGHMELVPMNHQPQHPSYHLPHHAVIRADSTTTKVRVVFDASCRTSRGPSLNDALMVGPTVQEELRSITMRSRIHPILLNADVKQMYRQILTDPRSNNLQLIVWSPTPDDPLQTYQLKTVTYGTASAPFLATRVLQQLADDEQDEFPEAAAVLRKDFYVDDLFSGAKTVEEAIDLRRQLEALLARGGFELRKWASNEVAVLQEVPPENRALKTSVELDRDQCIKSLGLHWEPATDHLRYKIHTPTTDDTPLTKRIALSQIARLFDPLGLVGPVITTAKLFMQALWTLKTDDGQTWSWDQELPAPIKQRWLDYIAQLPMLNDLRIERFILCQNPSSIQLHFFSDASEAAYGACCYIRSSNSAGETKTSLLTAKSKVAPLKQQSIPRLELCGALLAAQLYEKVVSALKIEAETYFWVDSTIVLCWLNSTPSSWTTFVANRVSKIQLATQNCSWNHVIGQQNPADHISRGLPAEDLLHDELWWKGPQWLTLDKESWPIQQPIDTADRNNVPDTRKACMTAVPAADEPSLVDLIVAKFSSYNKLLRVTAYCRRFIHRCQRKPTPTTAVVATEEMQEAEVLLIRLVQQQTFSAEWKQLQQSHPVPAKSRIRWFYPFFSTDQLIRIGGRLKHAQQPYDNKHQILLPSSHPISALLIRHLHETNLHAAPQLLLNILRLRYWVTGARSLARKIVQGCVICVKARPKLIEQFMAELPVERITATRPFSITGIDYWGPISLKPAHRRAAPGKAYVAVFVCFATKAVHLELVGDLSTGRFIQALRRFVARRGLCAEIFSDNGRNFIGANNELKQLVSSQQHHRSISEECASNGIRWRFNAPKASHFGGLWEAAIQSAQKHFVRAVGTLTLGMEDMQTLLAQIECCLNSRPLVPLSDDPTDFEPLSPGHLLTGSSLKAVPDADVTTIPLNRLRQFQQLQKLLQQFWQRWHVEYLCTLQSRSKWINPPINIQKGQLVLLKEDNVPPVQWPTARIIEVHPGKDGITRVVSIKTPTGEYTRPVSKLCILPIAPPPDVNNPQPAA